MSATLYQFPNMGVQLYSVEDPGITWYEEGAIISEAQLKNDAAQMECSVEELLEEMLLKKTG